MNEKYMNIAILEAKKGFNKNEIPIGAVIVRNDKIISKAHNKKKKTNFVTSHAEVNAIVKASKKTKNWRMDDCIMYVTIEPCDMCKNIIKEARIKKVIYGYESTYYKNDNNNAKYINLKNKECIKIMQEFFKQKRTNV